MIFSRLFSKLWRPRDVVLHVTSPSLPSYMKCVPFLLEGYHHDLCRPRVSNTRKYGKLGRVVCFFNMSRQASLSNSSILPHGSQLRTQGSSAQSSGLRAHGSQLRTQGSSPQSSGLRAHRLSAHGSQLRTQGSSAHRLRVPDSGLIGSALMAPDSGLISHGSKLRAHGSWLIAPGSSLMVPGSSFMTHSSGLIAHGS